MLRELELTSDVIRVEHYINEVSRAWFFLGKEHLKECKMALEHGLIRTTYSRAYYATYSVSKSIRFKVNGEVSLKGDDHRKAQNLPDDFPDASKWSTRIIKMYEQRLRADYDNWQSTQGSFSISHNIAAEWAEEFEYAGKNYLAEHGVET